MQHVSFITTRDKIGLIDLALYFMTCEKAGLLKRWCFTYHDDTSKPHYHVWLESDNKYATVIGEILLGNFIDPHNKKEVMRYVCCTSKGTLHPSLQSNFNVKAELEL